MKSVGQYDYKGLITSFLNQSSQKESTANDRMSYKGINLYSYNSVLATLFTTDNVLIVYYNIATYSRTSKKQAHLLRQIAKAKGFTIYVDKLNPWDIVLQMAITASRARSKRKQRIAELYREITNLQAFRRWLGDSEEQVAIPNEIHRIMFVHRLFIT